MKYIDIPEPGSSPRISDDPFEPRGPMGSGMHMASLPKGFIPSPIPSPYPIPIGMYR